MNKEKGYDKETQAVIKWIKKHHVSACWVSNGMETNSKFEIKRRGIAVQSDMLFTVEQRNALTYEEMKEMIMQMYKELKVREKES